jgi:pilus assembly protein CpaC
MNLPAEPRMKRTFESLVWNGLLLTALMALGSPASGMAADGATSSSGVESAMPLRLVAGKSLVYRSPVPFMRASLANPEIAETLVLSPRELYVMGKSIGMTNLTLWGRDGRVTTVHDVEVAPDLAQLKTQLHQLLPDETQLQVTATHDHVTLSGTISSVVRLNQVLALAEAYTPKKVVNLLQVSGVQQVMLEVRVAEMDRTLLRRLGFNASFTDGSGRSFGVSALRNLASVLPAGDSGAAIIPGAFAAIAPPFGLALGQAVNALFRFQSGSSTWTGFIDALKENNLAKVLAEPTLVAISGQEASFLAGGEFPIPVPQAFGVTTVQFKKFGVQLSFTPVVLDHRRMSIAVTPEVSELNFANGLVLQGVTVPSINTRRASTVIELGDGQSFAIAGLLRDQVREVISKYPLLGDIPILGALFRSSQFQKNETELIIVVTPHLVVPTTEAKLPLPTGRFIEPDDFDFYLMGRMQSAGPPLRPRGARSALGERIEGPVGHVMP